MSSEQTARRNTADDLKSIPGVWRVALFLRGMQRQVWGWVVLVIDFRLLTGNQATMSAVSDYQIKVLLIVINILVLAVLFGERALLNLAPLAERIIAKAKE